jgi:hypothetical protein
LLTALAHHVDQAEVIDVELGAGAQVARRGHEHARGLAALDRRDHAAAQRAVGQRRAVGRAGARGDRRGPAEVAAAVVAQHRVVRIDRAGAAQRVGAGEAEQRHPIALGVVDADAVDLHRAEIGDELAADEDIVAVAGARHPQLPGLELALAGQAGLHASVGIPGVAGSCALVRIDHAATAHIDARQPAAAADVAGVELQAQVGEHPAELAVRGGATGGVSHLQRVARLVIEERARDQVALEERLVLGVGGVDLVDEEALLLEEVGVRAIDLRFGGIDAIGALLIAERIRGRVVFLLLSEGRSRRPNQRQGPQRSQPLCCRLGRTLEQPPHRHIDSLPNAASPWAGNH